MLGIIAVGCKKVWRKSTNMRKLLITIGILLVIFVGMLAYKNVKVKQITK